MIDEKLADAIEDLEEFSARELSRNPKIRSAIATILAALSNRMVPGSTGSAEGWVLVPRDPTMKMLAAGQTAWLADPLRKSSTLYRAMIDAAGGRDE